MRLRKAVALVGVFLILSGCFMLYLVMDLSFPLRSAKQEFKDNKWLHFEDRLNQLENNLNKHHEAVGEIKRAIDHLIPTVSNTTTSISKIIYKDNNFHDFSPAYEMIFDETCPLQVNYVPQPNVQMLEIYKNIKFDNPDGGVWKQGWNIKYDDKQWNRFHKLKVFVVPHSHNDPGWLKTFEEYYASQTKNILNNMVEKLPTFKDGKFIWAEISFFSMWWDEIGESTKATVRDLIKNNQLEFVTGGWVMNDEANSHWLSIVHQLNEGHQWLKQHLNYTPQSSWAIDPFGHSPVMPFLLKQAGLKHLLIQRTHYSVKKYLAQNKQLEFRWKQLWDNSDKTELFTHMMPFYSYDVPHTCGPDPKICCQFDFRRLPNHGITCPWGVAPKVITEHNVRQRAELLLDQYRKKAQLYRTNAVLAPLGDDFRYDHPTEWDNQFKNYQMLFDYMNSNPDLHVEAKFGTLSDYFKAVTEEQSITEFPSLTGDFFTYADRDKHYWSGYYTSRPFYKRVDRVLLSYIRAAEVILTIAYGSKHTGSDVILSPEAALVHFVSEARKSLSLFQHHDGVTGTSRDPVVIDFGEKMMAAIFGTQHVIQQSVNLLLSGPKSGLPGSEISYYNIDDTRQKHDSLPERFTITIGKGAPFKKVVLFNSFTYTRQEVVTFLVSTPFVQVTDLVGNVVTCQISPIFIHGPTMSESTYELAFIANVPALSVVTYTITAVDIDELTSQTVFSIVKIFNHNGDVTQPLGFPNIEVTQSAREFTIKNSRITAAFNELGLLKAIRIGVNTLPVHLDFAKYDTTHSGDHSGAYLFLPGSEAQQINIESSTVVVLEGPIYSQVIVQLPKVHHVVSLYNSPGADSLGVEIQNTVDIQQTKNFEMVMRLLTNINNTGEFFTDLNGYEIIRRKRSHKLPLQGNYYPMPTIAYLEDKNTRLSILTSTPLGCACLKEGQIEVMLDRRLSYDDNRGLGQGVLDNHPTRHIFRLILERRTDKCQSTADNHPAGFPSISSHVSSQSLLNPLIKLLRNDDSDTKSKSSYSAISNDIGVDFTLAMMRPKIITDSNEDHIGLVVHRQHLDICYSDKSLLQQFPLSHGKFKLEEIVPFAKNIYKSSLTFLHVGESVSLYEPQELCPMSLQSYVFIR